MVHAPRSAARVLLVALLACLLLAPRSHAAVPAPPGGPILVVTSSADRFGGYYPEILRAEGLNEFATADIAAVTPERLAAHRVVVLAAMTLTDAQATVLGDWVHTGGDLIAMRPDDELAGLLGLGATSGTLGDGYLAVDTATAPGTGITGATMQFHGSADRHVLAGARSVATLYSDATTATADPAVTLRNVGAGQAAAFTYDLARSVVYTRQGNPAWAGQDRDGTLDQGSSTIRSDDLFFGGNGIPDWVDLGKVAVPQADEQQRLLANLITQMSAERMPLPRLWYFPHGHKAAVVLTGDDHGGNNTREVFDGLDALSPAGCSVADWTCLRGTSYVFPTVGLTDGQLAGFVAKGFEVALHLKVGGPGDCNNFTSLAALNADLSTQLGSFAARWPSAPASTTIRTHCVVWSDWDSQPLADQAHGIRLNTDYYYWPGTWTGDRPGMFTGSGIPMRFADRVGDTIDVFQAPTQIPDESQLQGGDAGLNIARAITSLLDNAQGANGYYGAFTVNMHTDFDDAHSAGRVAIVDAALARHVPVISARQLLTWLDGRDGSSFQDLAFGDDGRLTFGIARGAGSTGLEAMLPVRGGGGELRGLTRDGQPVATTARTVKGIDYLVFDAVAGQYEAAYAPPPARDATPGSTATQGVQASVTPPATTTPKARSPRLFPYVVVRGRTLTFRLRKPARLVLTVRDRDGKVVRRIRVARRRAGIDVQLRCKLRPGTYKFTLTAIGTGWKQTARGTLKAR
jgi:hypothetical protein